MLFKKKEKDIRPFPGENSRPPRYVSITRVSINGFEGEAVLRNVSTGGFRMESRTYVAIAVGEHYIMWIKPESASGLEPFELEVEVRWIQSAENKFSSGFLIVKYPSDGSIDKYIRYAKDYAEARSITA